MISDCCGIKSLPIAQCQLSHMLEGARVIMCGRQKPLATSLADPNDSL